MRTLTLKKGSVTLYESIKELPIGVFADFQRYLVQDAGIGSTFEDLGRHYQKAFQYLGEHMVEEASAEVYNLYQQVYLTISNINIGHISFACLVHSINAEPLEDRSETALRAVCDRLGKMGLTQGHVEDILEEVKKKIDSELTLYYPGEFATGSANIMEEIRRRALLQIKLIRIQQGVEEGSPGKIAELIRSIDAFQLTLNRPKNFDPGDPANYVRKMEKGFENLCASLEDLGVKEPKRLTVFEFYARVEYFKNKQKKQKKK